MSNSCHVHDYGKGGFELKRCNLSYGCGAIGCMIASKDSPGYYNDAGGYQVEPGVEVKLIDVGTPEEIANLNKALDPATSHEEAIRIFVELGISVSHQNHCQYCGWCR